jgi:23S rRNA-/tRNA-specific pseudouridylate synthase
VSSRRWLVGAGDPLVLGALVARAGGDEQAIAEGRVFVGRARATSAEKLLTVGDEVTIGAPDVRAGGSATVDELRILHRDAELVAVHKPAGMVTIPDLHGSAQALSTRLAKIVGVDPRELHPTSRLDREVSGVVVFTLTKPAAARLTEAREQGRYRRRYLAIAHHETNARAAPTAPGASGVWDAPIGRDRDPRKRKIRGRDPVPARTRFAVIARASAFALLALAPETGRTHQLRLHASDAGLPLLGDRAYGGKADLALPGGRVLALERIFLHAARITIPGRDGAPLTVTDEVPPALHETWASLGGAADAWDTALAWPFD